MINVLFTIPNFKTAGSQFVLGAIFQRLDGALFKPYVLVEKFPECFPDYIPEEARLHISEAVGKRAYISTMAKKLRELQIDVVHSWDYKSNSIEALACRKAGVKYLYTKKNNAWSKRWFAKSVLSHHVAYNNPDMKSQFFSSWLLRSKISFIPHGLDTNVFAPVEKSNSISGYTIGCIGVISENKNQLMLLKALRKLPEHVRVSFYGKADKAYLEMLQDYIANHGLASRVSFNGFVQNHKVPKVLAGFDTLVLASKNEGLPLTIMEAMACGVPVLSSNSGGGARYLLKDGAGGFIFENATELATQLEQLLDNEALRIQLATAGRQRIVDQFSIANEVQAYSALYQKLAAS
ncbi:MAG: glycosyltransferase family 4 protein [Marinirhabdus sp.]|nr:glycosyltransferase family 4 protein [Marinirhabdus sp.]